MYRTFDNNVRKPLVLTCLLSLSLSIFRLMFTLIIKLKSLLVAQHPWRKSLMRGIILFTCASPLGRIDYTTIFEAINTVFTFIKIFTNSSSNIFTSRNHSSRQFVPQWKKITLGEEITLTLSK